MFRNVTNRAHLLLKRQFLQFGVGITAMASRNATSGNQADRLVWVDLEMSGLDVDKEHILEMACVISDGQLNVVAEGPNLVIHHPDEVLEQMGDWCKEHHGEVCTDIGGGINYRSIMSGLTEAVRRSKISLADAESKMLEFVAKHTPQGKCPLAGNSVHTDKVFLQKYMPRFMNHLHYRIVDVSTVKELCRRWYPEELKTAPEKALNHRALDDIKESIKELQYYKKVIFK